MSKKFKRAWMVAVVVVAGGMCGASLQAAPVSHHITVTVTEDRSTDFKNIPGSPEKSKHQTRQLLVKLDSRDTERTNKVSVKWRIYAHKMADHSLVTVKSGTVNTQIDALKAITVKSDKASMHGTPKHEVTTRKRIRGKVHATTKSHPAEGEEYYGYTVDVYVGSELIESISNPPTLARQ